MNRINARNTLAQDLNVPLTLELAEPQQHHEDVSGGSNRSLAFGNPVAIHVRETPLPLDQRKKIDQCPCIVAPNDTQGRDAGRDT